MKQQQIIVIGGGTGGHVFPALSLCRELISKDFAVTFVTDQRGVQYDAVKDIDRKVVLDSYRQPKLRMFWSLFRNTLYCMGWFLKERPAMVVSFGGYTSVAAMLAAQFLRIPTMIHEQNAVLGKAHRITAPRAKLLATSFPTVKHLPVNVDVQLCGSPVRPNISNLYGQSYALPKAGESFRILVFGGSQGARVFSEVIPEALKNLELPWPIEVIQQCRAELVEKTAQAYEDLGIQATVDSFFNDIEDHYRCAHLIIARSGASTVAELTIAGRPAILVPYPFAADNHQQVNADQLEKTGGAWVVLEKDFTTIRLKKLLQTIFKTPALLCEKADRMQRFAKPQATQTLAHLIATYWAKNIDSTVKSRTL